MEPFQPCPRTTIPEKTVQLIKHDPQCYRNLEEPTPFNLMDLPIVAQEKVLCHMDPGGIIEFAYTSRRSLELSRCVKFKVKNLRCDFDCITLMVEQYPDEQFLFEPQPGISGKEKNDWIRNTADNDLLPINSDLHDAVFYIDEHFYKNWEWLQNRQNSISYLKLRDGKLNDKEARIVIGMVLDGRMEEVKHLRICIRTSDTFRFTENLVFKYWPEILQINNSHWLSLDQLISCDCPEIILTDTKLTDQEINIFLKTWQGNEKVGLSKLRKLFILRDTSGDQMDEDIILRDIPTNWQAADLKRVHKVHTKDGECFETELNGGCDIQRSDGLVGTIQFFQLHVEGSSKLELYVW